MHRPSFITPAEPASPSHSGSLFDLLYKNDHPMPELRHTLKLLKEVALGIFYLHESNPPVLHLDLKSANVLIDENGTAKICDFGMSHVMEDAAEAAEDRGSGIGSPQVRWVWGIPGNLHGS